MSVFGRSLWQFVSRPAIQSAGLLLLGLLLLDLMSVIAKILRTDYPAATVSMARNVFALIPLVVFIYWENRRWLRADEFKIRQWRMALVRGLLVALAQLCLYGALGHLALATAITIAYSGPLFITLLSIVWLGERVGLWRWSAVLVGFVGVLLVIRPGSDLFSWWSVLPIGAALLYAQTLVLARLFEPGVSNAVVNFYSLVGAIAGSVMLMAATVLAGTELIPGTIPAGDWLLALFMGSLGGTGVYCLTLAFRRGEASFLAPIEYFGIFTSLILGWLVFGEWPIAQLFPGALLIVGAGIVIVLRGHKTRAAPAKPAPEG